MQSVRSPASISDSFERGQRALDVAVAILMLVVCCPVFVLIAALVKITSHGPVLFRAERVGRGGRPFRLVKFRTMYVNADTAGPGITRACDPRVTSLGRWLRKFKLDELPQLLNVLKGELSLVGPRPEDPRYVVRYTPEQLRVLSVRPGITSIASVRYRHEGSLLSGPDWEAKYVNVVMQDKLRLELEYLDRRTLGSDIGVMWQTLLVLFR